MGEQGLFAQLEYKDVDEAVRWLHNALGFDLISPAPADGETTDSAELRRAGGVIVLSKAAKRAVPKGQSMYIWTADPDGLFERATAEGAKVVVAPEDGPEGRRRASVLDPEGHEWTFGAYEPGSNAVRIL
jgi:uncharacterized glyoxalase superfamily protein PhnB